MSATTFRTRILPLGITGALALALLAGVSFGGEVVARPAPDKTAAAAQSALAKGQTERAIALAEAVVAANPREPSYRALLGQAYLKAGRFNAAATALDDALSLGDESAKTALALALAHAANGDNAAAVAVLNDWREAIPVADLGLALALAGQPERGSGLLSTALRAGENTPKLRQNLAYAYALDGRWREARLMMSQDVPADQIDARISEWAARSAPEEHQVRVAALLGTPVRSDPGQPARLALNVETPAERLAEVTPRDQLAAAEPVPAAPADGAELPPIAPAAAPAQTSGFAAAFAAAPAAPAPAPAAQRETAVSFVAQPVVRPLPFRHGAMARVAPPQRAAPRVPARLVALPARPNGTHLVQLGSFSTEQGARRAWSLFAARTPELRNHRMTITRAEVRGKTYFRVAAAGLQGQRGAWSLCSTVKSRGLSCFAYAAARGLPGSKPVPEQRLAVSAKDGPLPVARSR